MEMVRYLNRTPYRQPPVRPIGRHCAILLHWKMSVPLIEEGVLENMIGLIEAFLDIAKL